MTEQTPKIRIGEKLGFFTFSGSDNIVYQFKSMYYLFFLTNVVKINVFWAGTILTIGTIWDALNDPLLGYWAVNHRFKNGETIRPFALWYSIPWAITTVLLFTDFKVSELPAIIIAIIVYIVFEVFNTFNGITYNSMAGVATNRDEDRKSINVFRNLGGILGTGIGAVACLPLVKFFGGLDRAGNLNDSSALGFFKAAIVMGALIIIGSFIHYFTTKERVKQVSEETEKLSPRRIAGMLLRCKSWVLNMVFIICYGVINLLLMSCITYYATYILKSTAAATPVQAAYLVTAIISSFLVSFVDKKVGRRNTMMIGCVVNILGKIWFILNPYSISGIYVNAISVGVAATFAFVLFNTNRNNIVDIIEAKEGRRIDSMIATGDNLASKLATAGATQLITVSLAAAGMNAALPEQPEGVIKTIVFMLGWAPAIVSVVMLVAAYFLTIERDLKEAKGA
jgi:sugar (glycoside-pentoside-hexuronide) transporter